MGYSTGRKPWRSDPYQGMSDESRTVRTRVFYFGLLVIAMFAILSIQLARMQLVNGDKYILRADTNRLRQVAIEPTRGLVYDRHGVPLVENRAGFAAAVVAADVPEARQMSITIALQEVIGVPASDIAAKIDERRASNDPFTPAVIKADLTQETAFALRQRLVEMPGVRVIVEAKRHYTYGTLMANIMGFVGRIDEDEYKTLASRGYQLDDSLGKAGVEMTYESVLRGTPGMRDIEADASGREISVIGELPAKPGNSLVLSVDVELQQRVEDILRSAMGASRNAAAGVIDVRTGDLLALVSVPTYDSNTFNGNVSDEVINRLLTDPGKPLVDHAIAEMYPPGSTFKQVTGLAALQEGVATAGTTLTSPGYLDVENEYVPGKFDRFKDWSALGTLNFYRGVAMSSDVYFYYLSGGYVQNGKTVFQGLGPNRLADWARRFGLGAQTGIDLPGESAGTVPDPEWKKKTVGEDWLLGDTYNFGIGQGYMAATPIQMLLVTAAIANGGNVLTPHVVKELRDPNGQAIQIDRQVVKRNLGVDRRNLDILREGMRQAVADGSATNAKTRFTQTAGKTGTAEFGERRPDGSYQEHGWFTGFAPYDNPQIAVVVFLDVGNGAGNAAPTAARIIDYFFSRGNLAQGTP